MCESGGPGASEVGMVVVVVLVVVGGWVVVCGFLLLVVVGCCCCCCCGGQSLVFAPVHRNICIYKCPLVCTSQHLVT